MTRGTARHVILALAVLVLIAWASGAPAAELVTKSCTELIAIADGYQQDLKTVDLMLASAIDAGELDRIKTYRLKKNALKKKLDAVLKAIDIKSCSKQ
jgi:hypothetical protein